MTNLEIITKVRTLHSNVEMALLLFGLGIALIEIGYCASEIDRADTTLSEFKS